MVIMYYTRHCLLSKLRKIRKWCNYCLFNKSDKVCLQVVIDSVFNFFLSCCRTLSYYQKIKLSIVSFTLCQSFLLAENIQLSKEFFPCTFFGTEMKVNIFCECWVLVIKKSSSNLSWLKLFNVPFAFSLGFWMLLHMLWNLELVHSRPSQRFKVVKVHQAETEVKVMVRLGFSDLSVRD